MRKTFIAEGDGDVTWMPDLSDEYIFDMYCSDYVDLVFRIVDQGIEYADVDPETEAIVWKVAEQAKEE